MLKALSFSIIMGSLLTSFPACAATYSLNVGSESIQSVPYGSFSDEFHFNLSNQAYVTTQITQIEYIKGFKAELFNQNGLSQGNILKPEGYSQFGFTTLSVLPAASYFIKITGKGAGFRDRPMGRYGIEALAVSPVPEPFTLSLLGAGLGVMARRVRSNRQLTRES